MQTSISPHPTTAPLRLERIGMMALLAGTFLLTLLLPRPVTERRSHADCRDVLAHRRSLKRIRAEGLEQIMARPPYTAQFRLKEVLATRRFRPATLTRVEPTTATVLTETDTPLHGFRFVRTVPMHWRRKVAILENPQTGEATYLRYGEVFRDAKVLAISEDGLAFQQGHKTYYLARSPFYYPPLPAASGVSIARNMPSEGTATFSRLAAPPTTGSPTARIGMAVP